MKTRNPIVGFFYGSFLQVLFWSFIAFILIGFAPWLSAIYFVGGIGLLLNKKHKGAL